MFLNTLASRLGWLGASIFWGRESFVCVYYVSVDGRRGKGRGERGRKGGREGGTYLCVYHGLRHVLGLVLRADDVKEDLDGEGAVGLGGNGRVGGVGGVGRRSPGLTRLGALVQLLVGVVEVLTWRSGAASSVGDLSLGRDGDGQEEDDGQQRAERTEEIGSPHVAG